jgi:uncharacterized membrane protein YidH (DUF202 family)
MSMRRTGMSFQRTRMSADRTLMSEMRTALSLIGFGFTINQAFQKMQDAGSIQNVNAPRNFGVRCWCSASCCWPAGSCAMSSSRPNCGIGARS